MSRLGYYHILVTGSAFRVPYTLESNELFAYHREGVGLPIHMPKWYAARGLLTGKTTGLLYYAFMVMGAVPGLFLLVRQKRILVASTIGLTFSFLFLVISGFPSWHGGFSTGPRLLLPALSMIILPAAVWFDCKPKTFPIGWIHQGLRWVFVIGMSVSLGGIVALNAAGGRMPFMWTDPWSQYLQPALKENRLEGHIGKWLDIGLDPTLSLGATVIIIAVVASVPILLAWRWEVHASLENGQQRPHATA